MKRGFKSLKPLGGPRDPRHGTMTGYAYWGCRCEKCTEANRVTGIENRAQKLVNLKPEDHGKAATYLVGCRCDACKQAYRVAHREKVNRRQAWKLKKLEEVDLSALA